MEKINVLVSGIGGGSHGEQIIKALKLAKQIDLRIIGTDIMQDTTGKRLVDIFYKMPYTYMPEYKTEIAKIIKKHDIKFMFHGSETELKFISENRDFLKELSVMHPLNSDEVIKLCMNKYETFKKLEQLGIKVGKYKKINSIDDIRDIDFFPLVLKPSTGSGGSAYVNICFDKEDLELAATYMLKYNIDIIAQEYLYSDDEYTVGVSSNDSGKIIGSICIKRMLNNSLTTRIKINKNNKKYIISTGISQGMIVSDKNILAQAENISTKLNSVGPLNLQCRVIDGILYPFEINPRLSGTTSLRALAGYNEPEAMILDRLFKQSINLTTYKKMTILRTIEEIVV